MEMHALSTLATTQLVVWIPLLIASLNTRILLLTKQIQLLSTVFHSFVIQKLVVFQPSKLAMMEINVPLIPAIKPLEIAWTLKSLALKIQMINAAPLYVTLRLVVSNKLLWFAMMEKHAQMILAILSLEPVFTLQLPVLLLQVVVSQAFVMKLQNNASSNQTLFVQSSPQTNVSPVLVIQQLFNALKPQPSVILQISALLQVVILLLVVWAPLLSALLQLEMLACPHLATSQLESVTSLQFLDVFQQQPAQIVSQPILAIQKFVWMELVSSLLLSVHQTNVQQW
jgi:hypothetical protein